MRTQKKMMPISVRLDEDVRAALDKIAAEDDRSLSYLVNLACRRFIESAGKRKKGKI